MADFPRVDFSILGELPQVYRQGQQQRARQRTLADIANAGGNIDYGQAARGLFQAGDFEGGLSLAKLADAHSNQAFERDIATRRIQLAEEAARDKPTTQVLEDASGNKRLFRVEPYARGVTDITPGSSAPTNPFSSGKQTEAQSKDSLYASRMFQAESILRDPQVMEAATNARVRVGGALAEKVPFGLGRMVMSEGYQKFDQAQRDFINAVLRRESGAVISESEFDNAKKQYFPQPGDTQDVIAQKQRNRAEAIKGVAGGGGPAYRPPFTFGPQGELVSNQPQQAAPATVAANNAPARGAPARPASKADYDALPSGATYIAPDGSTRTKK